MQRLDLQFSQCCFANVLRLVLLEHVVTRRRAANTAAAENVTAKDTIALGLMPC